MDRATRLFHLSGRFFRSLAYQTRAAVGKGALTSADLATLNALLSPTECDLFFSMRPVDQRHALDVCASLRAAGHDVPDLLRAALLHDVGKAQGPLPLPGRVVFALVRLFLPSMACWLARPAPDGLVRGWRRPFVVAIHHPALGARAAERAGSNPTVVRLIREHDSPGQDPFGRLLYHFDSR